MPLPSLSSIVVEGLRAIPVKNLGILARDLSDEDLGAALAKLDDAALAHLAGKLLIGDVGRANKSVLPAKPRRRPLITQASRRRPQTATPAAPKSSARRARGPSITDEDARERAQKVLAGADGPLPLRTICKEAGLSHSRGQRALRALAAAGIAEHNGMESKGSRWGLALG